MERIFCPAFNFCPEILIRAPSRIEVLADTGLTDTEKGAALTTANAGVKDINIDKKETKISMEVTFFINNNNFNITTPF
jgi:hypothetical protein